MYLETRRDTRALMSPASTGVKRRRVNDVDKSSEQLEDVDVNPMEYWPRPPLSPIDTASQAVVFQQIDVEEVQPPNSTPQIRMYGATANGHSVLVHVHGFLPYFYAAAPRGFGESTCSDLQSALNTSFGGAVAGVELTHAKNLMNYTGSEDSKFLKIITADLRSLPRVRGALERGEFAFRDMFVPGEGRVTFGNVAYTLRFMIDHGVVGMNWIELPAGTYSLRHDSAKVSRCQIEADCESGSFLSHAPVEKWLKMAPLRVLSFDIECAGRKGIFPDPNMDSVIQIAAMVTRQGESAPFVKNIYTLGECAHIVGSQIFSFDDEAKLLEAWASFFQAVDPDLVIGYNIANFDFPYLVERAKVLKANAFPFLGRERAVRTEVRDTHFSSKAYGTRDSKHTELQGRLQLDMLQVMQRDYKLRSYSLNSVSFEFLGEQKEDVHHSLITTLQNSGSESRRRLAVYCLKDAYLPQRLMDRLMCFINYTEMARVTGVPFNYLLSRGQQIKVVSQLFRKAREDGYLVPSYRGDSGDEQYEGATVLEPRQGYYDVPIAKLDFASLYPSIMMAHNLCYTTLLDRATINRLNLVEGKDYIVTPNQSASC